MFIKPKPDKPKRKREKLQISPEHPEYVRIKQMAQIGQDQLSRDCVIERRRLSILSWDYVIEHGKEFGTDLCWDQCYGFFVCDISDDKADDKEDVYFTGLSYEVYRNGNLMYYEYFKDGREDGEEVVFYPSGVLKSYGLFREGKRIGKYYAWYESGRIEMYCDGKRWFELDEEGYILRKKEKKR